MEESTDTIKKIEEALGNLQSRGAILEPTFCWVQAQRENGATLVDLNAKMLEIVDAGDIHAAKETLAGFIRDKRGDLLAQKRFSDVVKGRIGINKTRSEADDIFNILEWLDELGQLPVFMMTGCSLNKLPKKTNSDDEQETGSRLKRMEDFMIAMDRKVEAYQNDIKREIYSIKPSYASMMRELQAPVAQAPAVIQPLAGTRCSRWTLSPRTTRSTTGSTMGRPRWRTRRTDPKCKARSSPWEDKIRQEIQRGGRRSIRS